MNSFRVRLSTGVEPSLEEVDDPLLDGKSNTILERTDLQANDRRGETRRCRRRSIDRFVSPFDALLRQRRKESTSNLPDEKRRIAIDFEERRSVVNLDG